MAQAIQTLFEGPVDIVGDVHGEITALNQLLAQLGYAKNGRHPKGRRLVFVGDLIDRGEDSPAVLERVAELVAAERAQCVLGNHELNLLLDSRKEGNGWFYPADEDHDHAEGHFLGVPRLQTHHQRQNAVAWLSTLPLALERADLRVVHACWHPPAIAVLRADPRPTTELYAHWSQAIDETSTARGLLAQRDAERIAWAQPMNRRELPVPMMPAAAAIEVAKQTDHPVKALTSGLERQALHPFFAGGKWRMTEREAWWQDYDDEAAVVFGHYWRWAGDESHAAARSRGPNLFADIPVWDWLGQRRNALCIDYSAGLRWRERHAGVTKHEGLLAAVRWPEREIHTTG